MRIWLVEKLNTKTFSLTIVTLAVAAYLTLAIGSAMTKSPWWDEAWFASPALNLITKGSMGTTVLEPSGWLKGVDRYTYWVMPLYLLAQAGWFRIIGFGLLSMRFLSAVWGMVMLAAWFLIMKALSGDKKVALLTLVFLALDYDFIMMASEGRMDMMSAALGFSALAAYLCLRKRNFNWAIVASHSLVAASAFTHPNGYLAFVGLLFLTLYFDRQCIKWRHLAMAMMPYLIGAIGWGLYILQSPSLFYTQFHGNASSRLEGLTSPLSALKREMVNRYLHYYAFGPYWAGIGHGFWAGPIRSFPIFILVGYGAAVIAAFFTRGIRQHPGYRALFILMALYFLSLTLFDGHKRYYYLIYIFPMYAAVLAVWIRWCWEKRLVPAWVIVFSACCFISLNIGGVINRMLLNSYQNSYMSAVNFLKQNSNQTTLIMGSAELGFQLGFNDHLVDDYTLGYYSGKWPDLIVVGQRYEQMYEYPEDDQPEIYQHVNHRLTQEFRQVYDRGSYKIYARQSMGFIDVLHSEVSSKFSR